MANSIYITTLEQNLKSENKPSSNMFCFIRQMAALRLLVAEFILASLILAYRLLQLLVVLEQVGQVFVFTLS